MPPSRFAVHFDDQHRKTSHLVDRHVRRAGDLLDQDADLVGFGPQDLEVVAVELDAHVRAKTGDHLVHSHFDGLSEDAAHARHAVEILGHCAHEIVLGRPALPRFPRLQGDEDVGDLEAHRVGRHLGAPGPRPDVVDFVAVTRQEVTLDLRAVADRLVERDAREADGVDHDGLLPQARDELRAELRREQASVDHQRRGEAEHQPAPSKREAQQGAVSTLQPARSVDCRPFRAPSSRRGSPARASPSATGASIRAARR